jgi:Fe-S-cluster containining protein
MDETLKKYSELLARVDDWFAGALKNFPSEISCGEGCSGCCRGLFDVTLLDGFFLAEGFSKLSPAIKEAVREKARERIEGLRRLWPEWEHPYALNHRPEEDWAVLMPEDEERPCVLLSDGGKCLVYDYRPMTCRLHGLPLVDISGEVMDDAWCTENFPRIDPLRIPELRGEFQAIFVEEAALFREFADRLLGERVKELDLFIPAALLIEPGLFEWRRWWWQQYRALVVAE